MWVGEGLCRGAAAKSPGVWSKASWRKGQRSRLHNGCKAPQSSYCWLSLVSNPPVLPPASTAFSSYFNDLALPNNALKLHIMPFQGPSPTGRVPFSSLLSDHLVPLHAPCHLHSHTLCWTSALLHTEATCHMGLLARETWPVWTEVCCKYKTHTGFWR